jgi:HK97 family phage major capsid protein
VIAKIRKFKEATTNAYMWQPGLQAGKPDTLLGYPIVNAQDMPTLATGSAALWFGDFSEAYHDRRPDGDAHAARQPHRQAERAVLHDRRVGGGVVNFEAIKCITFEA